MMLKYKNVIALPGIGLINNNKELILQTLLYREHNKDKRYWILDEVSYLNEYPKCFLFARL